MIGNRQGHQPPCTLAYHCHKSPENFLWSQTYRSHLPILSPATTPRFPSRSWQTRCSQAKSTHNRYRFINERHGRCSHCQHEMPSAGNRFLQAVDQNPEKAPNARVSDISHLDLTAHGVKPSSLNIAQQFGQGCGGATTLISDISRVSREFTTQFTVYVISDSTIRLRFFPWKWIRATWERQDIDVLHYVRGISQLNMRFPWNTKWIYR